MAESRTRCGRVELETWVTQISVADIGKDAWLTGRDARQAALDVARRALREMPAPAKTAKDFPIGEFTFEEAEPGLYRRHASRFIDRIVVRPVGRGNRVPVEQRVSIFLQGAEEPLRVERVPVEDIEEASRARRWQ